MNDDLGYDGFSVLINYFTSLPDPNSISDGAFALIFKSLLKKDSITKEKSLNELLNLDKVDGDSHVAQDEMLVTSWIQIYPKLAIDSSRAVRLLSHQVQTSFFQALGGKAFSKYLRSSVPIWIYGTYDPENSVASAAKQSLLECFQNDQSRIDRLWSVFQPQILNFVRICMTVEDHETLSDKRYAKEADSIHKFQRVLCGCLSILAELIQNHNEKNGATDDTDFMGSMQSLLLLEGLWDHLELAVERDHLNIALLKSYLILMRHLFATKDGVPNSFLSGLSETRKIYKLVAKKFIKNVKLKCDPKSPNSSIIFSNVVLQLWDTLIVLTNVFNLPSDILKLWKLKKSFWEFGGNKSKARIFDFLSLGPCNLDPIYFRMIARFLEAIKSNGKREEAPTLLFDDEATINHVLMDTMCKQLRSCSNYAYRTQCVSCLIIVLGLFAKIQDDIRLKAYLTILDTLSRRPLNESERVRRTEALEAIAAYLDKEGCAFGVESCNRLQESLEEAIMLDAADLKVSDYAFQQGTIDIAFTFLEIENIRRETKVMGGFLGNLVNRLSDDRSIERPTLFFQISRFCVQKIKRTGLDSFSAILDVLASFIEKDFVDGPLQLLVACLQSDAFSAEEKKNAANDCFSKLEAVDESQLASFCLTVGRHLELSNDSEFPEINQYIRSLSEKLKLSDQENELIYKNASVDGVVPNRMRSLCNDPDGILKFFQSMAIDEFTDVSFQAEDIGTIRALAKVAFSNLSAKGAKAFLSSSAMRVIDRAEVIFEIIMESNVSTDFTLLLSFIKADEIPKKLITNYVHEALSNIDYNSIAPSNPLGPNIYLAKRPNQPNLSESMLVIGNLVAQMHEIYALDEYWLTTGLFLAEYISEFLLLQNKNVSVDVDRVLDIAKNLRSEPLEAFENESISMLLPIINDGANLVETRAQRILLLLDSNLREECAFKFYVALAYVLLLRSALEKLSSPVFEATEFKLVAYAKSPLILAVFLTSARHFLGSKKLDRIRNYVIAEILAAKAESSILSIGLKWLTLTTNFYEAEPRIEVIPRMKMPMIMNQISAWLDSSIAYDLAFVDMRVLIASILNGIIKSETVVSEQEADLASRLLSDNLNSCLVETARLDLKNLTASLLYSFIRASEHQTSIVHDVPKLIRETLTVMLDKECIAADERANNQQVMSTLDTLARILFQVDILVEDLLTKESRLTELFSSTSFDQYQKVCALLLRSIILRKQQDAVVEKQFAKAVEDGQDNAQAAPISAPFISIVAEGKDLEVEIDSSHTIDRYLWCWWLVFAYFEDVTLGMRASYISFLEESGLMTGLLDFIFDHVDVRDAKLLLKLLTESNGKPQEASVALDIYDIRVGYLGETESDQRMLLSLHLYYLALVHCPSVVRTWYRQTRDLQRKQSVEKFTTKYVLPLLVRKMLDEAAKGKDKLEKGDENLTIKVNNVLNEIKSMYIIDDQKMEMVVKIPHSYPLENTTVEGPLRLGVKENQWRAWLLASQRVISINNGSIMEAIEVFNRNVNLHFSGFEECAICYSILHQDLSLPSKTCPTCSNKFHSACLYKWFKSSGSSTCPLCRSSFDFRTAR